MQGGRLGLTLDELADERLLHGQVPPLPAHDVPDLGVELSCHDADPLVDLVERSREGAGVLRLEQKALPLQIDELGSKLLDDGVVSHPAGRDALVLLVELASDFPHALLGLREVGSRRIDVCTERGGSAEELSRRRVRSHSACRFLEGAQRFLRAREVVLGNRQLFVEIAARVL